MSTPTIAIADSAELKERIERFQEVQRSIVREVRKVIVGQDEVIEQVMISLFVGGHCLITGLPGTAKTLLVRTLAQTLGLVFKRIQFTPDLMPSDITGTDIIEEDPTTGHRTWTFVPGPIFSNILLADEINRTPPKTQSALLEAMQELSCTVRGHQYKIEAPFFVLATQNPIELEGTYPLPGSAARSLPVQHGARLSLRRRRSEGGGPHHHHARRPGRYGYERRRRFWTFQQLVRMVPIGETVARYAVELVRATRPNDASAPDFVKNYVNFGASVRAAQFVVLASKARALMRGRYHVAYEDIRALAAPILRHRILLNFHAESERLDSDAILKRLLEWKPEPK